MSRRFVNYISGFVFFIIFKNVIGNDCQFQGKHFTVLSPYSPWLIWNGSIGSLEISLCKPLSSSPCGENVSMCYHDHVANKSKNFGYTKNNLSSAENVGNFGIELEGENCSSGITKLTSVIYFKCGKSLGHPTFLSSLDACRIVLEWETTAACLEGSKLAEIKMTKCYGYNFQHLLINLDVLDDEYEVETGDDDDHEDEDDDVVNIKGSVLKVAVCRNMDSDQSCPGLGACISFPNNTKISLGRISSSEGLKVNSNNSLVISYSDSIRDSQNALQYPLVWDCTDVTTSIEFLCPEKGIGSQPMLLSRSRCHFSIRWETEAACPVQATTVNSSCSLTSIRHGVNVNFSSLATEHPHKVNAKDGGGDSLEYELYLCTDKMIPCGNFNSSVCQRNLNNSNVKSIGNFTKQTFRYFDGALQMVLEGGEPCGTGFYRNTIINFYCDRSTSNESRLSFAYEDMCTYVFNWNTSLACLTPYVSCSITPKGNLTFDLSSLSRSNSEENWRTANGSVILNVCRGLVMSDPRAAKCLSSAICLQDGDHSWNHGLRMLPPKYDEGRGAVKLEYVEGDICTAGKRRSSEVFVFCDPNAVNSQPHFIKRSDEGCHLELEWYSPAGCGIGHMIGQDCTINDPLTGVRFDLSPLKFDKTSLGKRYKVETSEYEYYISICAPVVNTTCSQSDVGVCQVSKKNRHIHSTGKWSDKLHYTKGALRLTYRDGDNYNSQPPVPRHTDIDFVCNEGAGLGEPLFVSETNRTYRFLWHTILACPSALDVCKSFVFDGKSYDLSFLIQQGSRKNWEVITSLAGKPKKLLLNLCRGLLIGPDIKMCNPLHSACLMSLDGNETFSLGRLISQPSVESDGVVLKYEGGERCGKDSQYSLEIHLRCNSSSDQSHPSTLEAKSLCKFVTTWFTSVACPNNFSSSGDAGCVLKLDKLGRVFDVSGYKGEIYEVKNGLDTYKISLCGELPECGNGSYACRTVGGKVEETVTMQGRKLTMSADGVPQLWLSSGNLKLLIQFKCNLSSSKGSISLLSSHSNWLLFNFETPSACFGKTIDCRAFDEEGNKYDLEALMKLHGNWTALGAAGDSCDFNLCMPLVSSPIDECRMAGSCLRKNGSGEPFSAGHISGILEAVGKGSLRLRYTGGASCNTGRRSTIVLLHCSVIEHSPVLMNTFDECESLIQWQTPFACPVKHATGKNCKVGHPSYPSQVFDLSLLIESGDYEIDFDVGKYFIRVCSKVELDNCRNMNAGACLVYQEKYFSMGEFNDNLEYNNGKLILNYLVSLDQEAERPKPLDCRDGGASTQIEFKCEHDNLGISSGPVYLSGSCHRKFEWVTSLACFKYRKVKCRVRDGGGVEYDLSHLALHDSNYEVIADNGKKKFVINVCSALVHVEGNPCPPNSSSCLIDVSTGTSMNIGSIPNEGEILSSTGGKLKMVYTAGVSTTVIYFICDRQAPETSSPKYLLSESSNYFFTWSTRHACSRQDQGQAGGTECATTDGETNHVYNLSSLQAGNPHKVKGLGQEFEVYVCREKYLWLLTYEHGTIMLRYSGGHACDGVNQTSSTLVTFVCPMDGEDEGPEFILKNSQCMHVFRWRTKLACKNELKCLVPGLGYSLSSLISHGDKHEAKISVSLNDVVGATLSVCSNITSDTSCIRSHAVCIRLRDGNYRVGGVASRGPSYDADSNQVSLVYPDGDECPSGRWSSKISFICSKVSEVTPALVSISDSACVYEFEWRVDSVCRPSDIDSKFLPAVCMLNLGNSSYDISGVMGKLASEKIEPRSDGSYYVLRLCSPFEEGACSPSVLCLFSSSGSQTKGYGLKTNAHLLWEGKDLKLTFGNGEGSAIVIFICDPTETVPDTYILYEGDRIVLTVTSQATCASSAAALTTAFPPHSISLVPELNATSQGAQKHGPHTLYLILGVIAVCTLFVIVGIFLRRWRRSQRGYEPVDAMHYRDYDEEMNSTLFQEEGKAQSSLQNYNSDDDLML